MSPVIKKSSNETNESAVSPVVGVMLMLVVTIIIAAIVSAFAGGLATSTQKAPSAVLDVQIKTTDVSMGASSIFATDFTIDHISGEAIPAKDLAITFAWTNASDGKTAETHTYYPAKDTNVNFTALTGVSYWGYGNSTMYLNGNPSAGIENATLENGAHIQTAGNYIYNYYTTPKGTVMTGNPFMDVLFTGKVTSTYDAATTVWSGGVVETLGDSVHVTIAHIPTNMIIFDKEVKVQ